MSSKAYKARLGGPAGFGRFVVCALLMIGVAPAGYTDPPPPEAIDAAIDKLVTLDPSVVNARVQEYKTQAEAWEAEAAKLKEQADALDGQAAAIAAQLDQLKAHAKALVEALGVTEQAAMAAPPPAPPAEPAMAMKPEEKAAAPAVNYQDHILPILKQRCAKCHNQDTRRSDLAVDSYSTLMEGGSSGAVITAGQPDDSRLFRLVSGTEEPQMPPSGDRLTAEQLTLISQWIQLGAPADVNSKVAMKKQEQKEEATAVFVAATIVDGPPPMPEVTLAPPAPELAKAVVARAVATSPRAPLAAVAGYRQILLYNLTDYTLIGALPFPEGEVYTLTFSVNGEVLVAGGGIEGDSGLVVLWNVRKGERVGRYGEEYDTIMAADISPDHRMIAMGGPSKKVKVYSVADSSLLYKLEDHTDWIYCVKFSPDGELLSTADRAGGLLLWQAANGRAVEALRGHNGPIHDLSYSADSVLLASAGGDGTVRLWDTWKYNQVRSFNAHAGGVLSVDFNPANELVTTGVDHLTKRWDAAGKNLSTYEALADWGYQARFGAEGKLVLAGSWTGNVAVWDAASGSRVADVSTAPAS